MWRIRFILQWAQTNNANPYSVGDGTEDRSEVTNRRKFLAGLAGAAGAASLMSGARVSAAAGKDRAIPQQIKMFNIDLNWSGANFPAPGYWADVSPEDHVRWCADLGANVIHSYTVSCNGYAWYKGGIVPPQPGLKHDYFREVQRLAHKRNMLVTGYYCVGANTKWGEEHPDLSYGTPASAHIPLTDVYLDYFCAMMADGMKKTGMEVCALDWIWNPGTQGAVFTPSGEPHDKAWIDAEKKLFTQLTGLRFPSTGVPNDEDRLGYERLAIERTWQRIRETRDTTDRNCLLALWMNHPDRPSIQGSKMFGEVDWYINENPKPDRLELARGKVRQGARLIQNLSGWGNHDAKAYLADPQYASFDMSAFAEPRANGLLPSVAEYLSKPVDSFKGKENDRIAANDYNIAALARFFRGLPMDTVIPLKA
jgi:hypothetical protein